MNCKDCKFYEQHKNRECGYCRRYAPRHISGVGTGFEDVLFPTVSNEDWCGEYVMADDRVLIGKDVKKDECDCHMKDTDKAKKYDEEHAKDCPMYMPF